MIMIPVIIIAALWPFTLSWAGEKSCLSQKDQILCRLDWAEEQSLFSIQAYKSSCEFPEGNNRSCLAFRICKNDEFFEAGSTFLYKTSDLNLFCDGKNMIDLLGSTEIPDLFIQVKCNKNRAESKLTLKNKLNSKECPIELQKL